MRCPACSTENSADNSFCESCGTRLGMACIHCGYKNSPTARFCGSCGSLLIAAEGELKHATVMFADIVGSTELIAPLSPEQALERLQPVVEAMCAAVARFGGTVVRTLGDGIMALFGAPQAQEGHAILACEAALAMQAELRERPDGTAIRIGLDSGRVVASTAGLDPTSSQGAHGLTVHLASRLQGLAEPGGTCLTEDCYRLVRPYCDVRPLGRRMLKGIPEAIEIYSLLGLKPAVASRQFRRSNLTAFRGRETELHALQDTLDNIAISGVKVIGISGLPGSGKSRLCFEFVERCRNRLASVFEARAQAYGRAMPMQLGLDFLRLSLRISPSDDNAASRRQVARELLSIAPTFEADLPILYDFLGLADEGGASSVLHPKARHARLLDIVRHIVRQKGATPSVILVEDLHWLDEASEDFIATLVDAVSDTRTMLIVNYRPGYAAEWMNWRHYRELPLSELNTSDTEALVCDLVGDHPELREIRQRVAERSGGNPFFAEELVRSLAENGVLFGELANYRFGTMLVEAPLPATVEAVIGARIDRLGDGEKALLQVAAIIGKEFPLRVLQQVAGHLVTDLDTALARLCEAKLIQAQATIDQHQFAFCHPLIQEVAYAAQLRTRRSVLHAAVAKAMEEFYRERRLNEFAGLLAYHYEAAGRLAEAANYAALAARWIGSTNPAQAIVHWQKVRALLQHQPRSPAGDSHRIMANAQIAWLGWREGMTADAAREYVHEGLDLARETDDSMIPMLLFVDGRIILASGGSADLYVARLEEALALLKDSGNLGRMTTLSCALSQAYGQAGLLIQALAASDAALGGLAHVEKSDHEFLGYNVEHWTLTLRARILVRLGRLAEGKECLDDLLAIESALSDPTVQFIPHLGCVDLAWCRGDARLAARHARRVVEIGDATGIPYLRVYGFACKGTAAALAKDFAGAAQDFAAGCEFMRQTKASLGFEAEMLASLADCHLRMGEAERAAAVAAEAIEVAHRRATRLPECRASIIRAAALLARHGPGRANEADDLFRRADQLIAITGARIYEPLLRQERARLTATAG